MKQRKKTLKIYNEFVVSLLVVVVVVFAFVAFVVACCCCVSFVAIGGTEPAGVNVGTDVRGHSTIV